MATSQRFQLATPTTTPGRQTTQSPHFRSTQLFRSVDWEKVMGHLRLPPIQTPRPFIQATKPPVQTEHLVTSTTDKHFELFWAYFGKPRIE